MGLPIMNDFFITLNNHCFICLKHFPQIKSASSTHSLQYLSRFLKLDLEKFVRNSKGHNLETEGELLRLLVELCEGCASLNSTFVRLYRQLEKIKMEFTSQLSVIQMELMRAGEIDADTCEMIRGRRTDLDRKSSGPCPSRAELGRSLAMADMLRRETVLKCSLELKRSPPRIMIKRLTGKKATSRKINTTGRSTTALTSKPFRAFKTGASKFIAPLKSGRFKCLLCGKEFVRYTSFYPHYSAHHSKVRFRCRVCSQTFSQRGGLKIHHENIHNGRRYFCKLCSKSFSSATNLGTHLRLKKCLRKGVKTGRPRKSDQIQSNSDSQVSETAAPPQVCDSSYNIVPKSEMEVDEIKMESVNLEMVVFPPDVDNGDVYLNYLSEDPLEQPDLLGELTPVENNNGNEHSRQRPQHYTCKICFKSFPSKSSLGGHMSQNHVNRFPNGGRRRHKQIASKKGKNNRALESQPPRKLTTLSKMTPPVKEQLTSSFSSMPSYKSCVQRNSNDAQVARKPKYKCAVCGNTFYDKSTFMRHYRSVHERLKKFKCQLCHYSSFRRGHVTTHMQRRHPS